MNILLVDDNELSQFLFSRILEVGGFNSVVTAGSGAEALEILSGETLFNLVLLDLNLTSDMDGLETMDSLRKIAGYENVPVVMVTAENEKEVVNKIMSRGANGYIRKDAEDFSSQLVETARRFTG